MTGPEHYQRAERLAESACHERNNHETNVDLALLAQVHATLALAAATIEAKLGSYQAHTADKPWIDVLGPPPPVNGRK